MAVMGDKIKSNTGTVYVVVAIGHCIYLALNCASKSVNFHVYENAPLIKAQQEILQKLNFVKKDQYWSLRVYKNDHPYSEDIIVGGIIFALAHVNLWTTTYPKL